MWVWLREFGLNVLANIAAAAASPTEMIGYAVAFAFGLAWLFNWHRKRHAEGKRGVDSWYFIALAFAVAISAVAIGAYGVGLRAVPQTDPSKIALNSPTKAAQPSGNPLQDAITAFLATRIKTADFSVPLPLVRMEDQSDGKGPYIAQWDNSLGPWPTLRDGFTLLQLRRSPNPFDGYAPKPLSEYEAGKKLPVIDSFLSTLKDGIQKLIDDGPRLRTDWWNALKAPQANPQKLTDELLAYRDNLKSSLQQIEAIRSSNAQYQDLIIATQGMVPDIAIRPVEGFLIAFQHASHSLKPDASRETLQFIMNQPEQDFAKSIEELRAWKNNSERNLIEIRRYASP